MFSLQSLIIQSSTVTVRNRRTAFRAVFQKKKKKKYFNNGTRRVKKQRATKVVTRSNGCSDRINPRCHQKERSIPKTKKKKREKGKKRKREKKYLQKYPAASIRDISVQPPARNAGESARTKTRNYAEVSQTEGGGWDRRRRKGGETIAGQVAAATAARWKSFPLFRKTGRKGDASESE